MPQAEVLGGSDLEEVIGDIVAGGVGVEMVEGVAAFGLDGLHGGEDAESAEDEDGQACGGVGGPSGGLGKALPQGRGGASVAESLGDGELTGLVCEGADGLLISPREEVSGVGLRLQ